MKSGPGSPTRITHPVGLVVAAALSWVPLIAIVVARIFWTKLSATITTHWSFTGIPDARGTANSAFWDFVPAAGILALTVTALVLTVGGDISRRAGAIGLGVISWLLGTITGIWFILILINAEPANAASYVLTLLGSGVAFGLVVGGAAALPRTA